MIIKILGLLVDVKYLQNHGSVQLMKATVKTVHLSCLLKKLFNVKNKKFTFL